MGELLHQPGFLGTSANFAADMTLVLMLLILAALTVGVVLARRGDYRTHRVVQTIAVAANAGLVLWMMILPFRDFVAPGLPERLGERFYGVTTLHAVVGASAMLLGVYVVLRANGLMPKPLRFNNYKRVMRISYALYVLATLLGVLVYLAWFVGNPNPPVYT
jgi:uncharacterized membrane protein YozB (DUF420 family)